MVAQPSYDTAPAVPCIPVPLPLFAAMRPMAARVEDYRRREEATRAYLGRGGIEAGPKLPLPADGL